MTVTNTPNPFLMASKFVDVAGQQGTIFGIQNMSRKEALVQGDNQEWSIADGVFTPWLIASGKYNVYILGSAAARFSVSFSSEDGTVAIDQGAGSDTGSFRIHVNMYSPSSSSAVPFDYPFLMASKFVDVAGQQGASGESFYTPESFMIYNSYGREALVQLGDQKWYLQAGQFSPMMSTSGKYSVYTLGSVSARLTVSLNSADGTCVIARGVDFDPGSSFDIFVYMG